jgi:hypothetical protein
VLCNFGVVTLTVNYDARADSWFFGGQRRLSNGGDSLVVKRIDLPIATATDLARALRTARRVGTEPDAILIDMAPDDEYSPKESVVTTISFVLLGDGRLAVRLSVTTDEYLEDDSQLLAAIGPLAQPLLRRNGARLVDVHVDGYRSTAPYFHDVVLTAPTRGKTMQDLYGLAESVEALFESAASAGLTRTSVVDLILGGRSDLLIGQPESHWLDVKSEHYDIGTQKGKIALAQAVSRFCNAEEGGVVVVGMSTKRTPAGDVIKSLKPVPLDQSVTRRYRQAIENKLFPFPSGLAIEVVKVGVSGGLVVISVPQQEEELKPFLVHGAIVDGRIEGVYISIVRRSGEDSIPITAQQIHATLAAGRALLRRGELPPRPSSTSGG